MKKKSESTLHSLPPDMRDTLKSFPPVQKAWKQCTPLGKNEWICWVTSAKKKETRQHRIEVMCSQLRQGKRRPCCWPGCPHRLRKSKAITT